MLPDSGTKDTSNSSQRLLPWDILSIIIEATTDLATLQSWACVCSVANTFAESLLWSHVCLVVEDNPARPYCDATYGKEDDPDILSRPIKIYADEGLDFHNLYDEEHPPPDIKKEELEFLRGITLGYCNPVSDQDDGTDGNLDPEENSMLLQHIRYLESMRINEDGAIVIGGKKLESTPETKYDTFKGELPDEHWGDIDDGCDLYDYQSQEDLETHRASVGNLVLDDVHTRKIRPRYLSLLSNSDRGFRKRSHFVTSIILAEAPHMGMHIPDYLVLTRSIESELVAKGAFVNLCRVKIMGGLRQQGWDRLMCLPVLEEVELHRTLDYGDDGWYYPESYLDSRYPLEFKGMEKLKRFRLSPIVVDEENGFCQKLQNCTKLEALVIHQKDYSLHDEEAGGWITPTFPPRSNHCRMGDFFRAMETAGGFPKSLREFQYSLKRDCQLARGTSLLYPPYNDPKQPTFSEYFVHAFNGNQLENMHLNVALGHLDKGLLHIMGTEHCFPNLKTLEINLPLPIPPIPLVVQDTDSQLLKVRLLRGAMALHTNIQQLRITGLQLYDIHALATNLPSFYSERIMYHNSRACRGDSSTLKFCCLAYLLNQDPPENKEWIRETKYIGSYASWRKMPSYKYFNHKNGKNAYTSLLRPTIWGIRNLDLPNLRIALINLAGYNKPQEFAISVDPFVKGGVRADYARLGIALGSKGDDGMAETHARMIAESNPSVRVVALYGYRFWIQRITTSSGISEDDKDKNQSKIVVWRLREALGDEKMKREVLDWMTDEDWKFLENAETGEHEVRFHRREGYIDDGEPVQYRRDYGRAKCECRLCTMWRSGWRSQALGALSAHHIF